MNHKSDLLDEPENFSFALGRGRFFNFFYANGDIQSLADLGNSFTVVNETRLVPFDKALVFYLAIILAAPLLPLLLFVFPLEEMIALALSDHALPNRKPPAGGCDALGNGCSRLRSSSEDSTGDL